VGSPTADTRGEVNEIDLPKETMVFWTGTLALNADGSPYHGRGITPTVAARSTRAGLAAGRDQVLDAALAVVLGAGNGADGDLHGSGEILVRAAGSSCEVLAAARGRHTASAGYGRGPDQHWHWGWPFEHSLP
jgi:hypothetical protein